MKKTFKKQEKKYSKASLTKTTKLHYNTVEDIGGFATESVQPGNLVKVITRGYFTSDDPIFYTYIDQISGIYLEKVFISEVFQFLILIHDNLSADIYINYIPVKVLMALKRDVKKGEVIRDNDIADIKKLSFDSINIGDTDKIIFCFKVHWKFGLFFDLHRDSRLDKDSIEKALGNLYRYLSFQYIYDVLNSKPHFDLMLKDGWFPFIEILGSEFKEISKAYQHLDDPQPKIRELISNFKHDRINRITDKWWKHQLFFDKKSILEAGIESYLRNDSKGFINCIKTLLTEIEGIIRINYFKETRRGKNIHTKDLISYVIEKGRIKADSDLSLFFPEAFFKYLSESIFPQFDIEKDNITLSRHTSSHGVAKAEDYNQERALQMILILDQIFFYI